MPDTIFYRTFPLSRHDNSFPSPRSACANAKRKNNRNEAISFGPPEKLAKLEKKKTTTTTTTTAQWIIPSSIKANQTGDTNSVQQIIQPIIEDIKPGCQRSDKKNPISLATADASLAHIPPCAKAMEAIVMAVLRKPHTSSYTHACGAPEARRAIAAHHSVSLHHHQQLNPENVIVTNGCSGALELSLASLLDPGTSLLVPNPGFPLYEEIAESHGASVVSYNLDRKRNWECDLDHLEEIMKDHPSKHNIRAMVVNNPSSHGVVFSEVHLLKLLDFCFKHRLPIVSDEVYGDLTFGSHVFHPMASIAASHGCRVPVITTSGLSKQFLVPGWRLGWAVFHDNQLGSLRDVEAGAKKLAKLSNGTSHLQQSAIPALLSKSTPGLVNWKHTLRQTLEHQAKTLYSGLESCDSIEMVCQPQGSMYIIVGLDIDRFGSRICNDVDFCHLLVQEENVFVLPGSSFGVPGTFRVAFTACVSTLEEASKRIACFCRRYSATRQQGVLPSKGVATTNPRE